MTFLRSRRGLAVCGVCIIALLFLLRPGANRLKSRIISSIGLALGRPVDAQSVQLRFLPQPGFELENFVIHDDPAFGSEPMLRAAEVTASLRASSLFRGRLEIARLDLTEPSLNLSRCADGHWNVESLIERAEKISVAPTAKVKTEKRPAFPYIDATQGRINFKFGLEKKPYALMEADFSLWQESEQEWGVRLKARPVRSDFNLTDTGVLQLSGSWQRAASLRDTPLQFMLGWDGAQLGQLTKLLHGSDSGWRGDVAVSASLNGTPANSKLSLDVSASDFHRFDVLASGSMRLSTQCSGHYSSGDNMFSEIVCEAPVGSGLVTVSGSVANPFANPAFNLTLSAKSVPADSLVAFARHAKNGVPGELSATGLIDAAFHGRLQPDSAPVWDGSGTASELVLKSSSSVAPIRLDNVPFSISQPKETSQHGARGKHVSVSSGHQIAVGPFPAHLGRPSPLTVQGRVGLQGYQFDLRGEAQLPRLLQAAHLLGIAAPQSVTDGSAKMDLEVDGTWWGDQPAKATGKIQSRSLRAELRGLNEPVEIITANLNLSDDRVDVQNLLLHAAGGTWRGSLEINRPCLKVAPCVVRFNLHADEVTLDRVNHLLNPRARTQPWYRMLSPSEDSASSYLMTVNASGKIAIDQMKAAQFEARHVSGDAELSGGKLRLSNLQANVLGGQHNGDLAADFTHKPPLYTGTGVLQNFALGQLAEAMRDDWITGTATSHYHLVASGLTANDLLSSAKGSFRVDASGGTLPHIVLTDTNGPLQVRHLTAQVLLHDAKFEIDSGNLEGNGEMLRLNGTASFSRILNLQLTRQDASGFAITGTLAQPHVSSVATKETRAALKQ